MQASDSQQLRKVFPWDETPRHLIRGRDHAFGTLRSTANGKQ
jgi:hypothetical protein